MASSEYRYTDGFEVTDEIKKDFNEHGYIMVRNLLDNGELVNIKKQLEENDSITKYKYGIPDEDRVTYMVLWNNPGDDVTGMLARSEKVVNTCEKLLGGEVFHFHSKLMMKEPQTGGRFLWHQDYGYWYKNGFLFPDLLTAFVAVDDSVKQNGCLQILRGSHKCGRLDHGLGTDQLGADIDRVNHIKQICPLEYAEMNAGDALFFHSNLLHTSGSNDSELRRWAFLMAYCRASNDTVEDHPFAHYTPIQKVANDVIKNCTNYLDTGGKIFLDPREDENVKAKIENK